MKNNICAWIACLLVTNAWAQSNPTMDRPIQQCIAKSQDKIDILPNNFSMGNWLYKLSETCDKLKETEGKKGGNYVVRLLEMEKELDEILVVAEDCPALSKAKPVLQEMKDIFKERQKVENFKVAEDKKTNSPNVFEEDKDITTMSLPRGAAGKIKAKAEKVHKMLK